MTSSYREQYAKAKDVRRGVAEQKSVSPKAPKRKDVIVEYRDNPEYHTGRRMGWTKWGKYRTVEEAEKAMRDQVRKHPTLWEFRIAP